MRGIAGSFVIVGDGVTAPIARGALVLGEGDRILAVGELDALARMHPAVRFERHDAVLLPGLVNAHTHLELSSLRGQVPGGRGFAPWVTTLIGERTQQSPEGDAEAIAHAVDELLAAGTAAVGDVTNTLAPVAQLSEAPLLACIFHEVFGQRRETAQVMLGMAQQSRSAIARWPSNLRYAPAPHAPFTLHPEVLCEIVRQARALKTRSTLHLCEHGAERAYLKDGSGPYAALLVERGASAVDWAPPGLDPIRYAASLGVLGPDVITVHLTDARPDELALVAQAQAPVVLCPRSNLHIELKLPPLIDILNAGIKPALGTDSLASNASLDVLEEAHALAERFPSVPARTLLAMATSFGAQVLGLADRVGKLAEGLAPGVIAFEHGAALPADAERFVLSRAANRRTVLARPGLQPLLAQEAA